MILTKKPPSSGKPVDGGMGGDSENSKARHERAPGAENDGWDRRIRLTGKTPRKEVVQPQVLLRLPCYDFTPVTGHTLVSVPPPKRVELPASGIPRSHGVTGGVYKTRERIHRDMLIRDY